MGKSCLSLASLSLGQLGQKYAKDADQPVWRKSVHFGWFGDICPRQFGTFGTKVRGGHEMPGGPQTNQETPRVL
ncbi:hypothetical protein KI387_040656, partial [Taxus chinensis]